MNNKPFRSISSPALSIKASDFKNLIPIAALALQVLIISLCLFAPHAITQYKLGNIMIAEIIVFVLALLPINYIAVSVSMSVLMFFFYYLNEYVNASRGRPINYLDVFSIKDAIKVIAQYPLIMNPDIIINFLITAALTTASCITIKKLYNKKEHRRYIRYLLSCLAAAVTTALLAFCISFYIIYIPKISWNEEGYIAQTGLLYGIFCEYVTSIVTVPEGYSANAVNAILEEYAEKSSPVTDQQPPVNIIMIMNESLSDYSLIGEPDFIADPLTGIHALDDNVAKGRLAVNIYGSNTCNTEFEAITGMPLAFLPKNTVPHSQYQLGSELSKAWEFTDLGYSCTPIHAYLGAEYRRSIIYSKWFENEFISAEKFSSEDIQQSDVDIFDIGLHVPTFGSDLEYINRFISDTECYRKIESVMKEDNENGRNSFTFTITMQNHGGYIINDGYETVNFIDAPDLYENSYLTLSSISDQAFIDFLDMLREYPEKTIVIMFGDHQPNIGFNSYKSKFSDNGNEYQAMSDDYIVPYIVWANYDIDWDLPEIMSANYLLTAVKASCGIEFSPVDNLIYEAMKEYPAITCDFAVNADGEFVSPEEALSSEIMKKYNIVEYYRLFDSGSSR